MTEQGSQSAPSSDVRARNLRRDLPVVEAPETQSREDEPPQRRQRRPRRRLIRWALFSLLPIAVLLGGYWYVTGGQIMSEDDANVNAERVGVSTDVSGIVHDVDVVNNQHVTKGQVLFRLDLRQFQIAVDQAQANLAQTELTLNSMKKDYQRLLDDTAAQQAQVNLDQINYTREAMLLRNGTAPQQAYDQAKYTLQGDQAKLQSMQQQSNVQLARLAGSAQTPTEQLPQYLQAKAQLAEAQRQLTDAVVRAPFSGVVTDVPSTAPGRSLTAYAVAFYLVDTDHVWVDAQPKETEMTYVRSGQAATVTVDTYPGVQWRGSVENISPAASQEFSLLPAENTSGNWVKVVQRIPMQIKIDTSDKSKPPLRAGMSAVVNVNTGHARGFPHF
jgi:membrane fusion protein, multidrug efflux system